MKNRLLYISLISAAFILTFFAIAWGAYFRSGLAVTEGHPSPILIRAPRQVDNFLENERNRQAALAIAEGLEPIYAIDPDEWRSVEFNLQNLRDRIELIRQANVLEEAEYNQAWADWEADIERQNEENTLAMAEWNAARIADPEATIPPPEIPLPPPQPEWQGDALLQFSTITNPPFSDDDRQMLVNMDDNDFAMLWAAVNTIAELVQLNHRIHDEVDFLTAHAVQQRISSLSGLDRASEVLVELIVLHHLRENAVEDIEQNRINFENVRDSYEHVVFLENQILVDEGEIVTADIYYVLEVLGMLRSDSIMDNLIPLAGVMGLVMAAFAIAVMYLMFYRPEIKNKREALLIFTVFVLTLALVWTLRDFSFLFLPILIFPLLISLLVDRKCALALTFPMILICFFIIDGSLTYLLFYLMGGGLLCLLSRFTTERNKVFIVGFVVAAIQAGLFVALSLITERSDALNEIDTLFINSGYAALNGILIVIIGTGSLPFWESLFGVVTPIKLLDLTNPTNVLLRRLTIEAPGTYHHSLIVANLAETAAYDIGANAHAARVGGYYHDIGKLKKPSFFAENLDGENPHDHMDPKESVKFIIGHVSYGLTLAGEHRLPQFVRDIIKEHQGTTLLQFFYAKAKEKDPDIDEKDFRYPFTIPQTRESACVMLADSVEAAARANIPKLNSVDEVEDIIKKIIRGKLVDGQLADSQLSIKDVSVIEQSFFRVLKGMYHERIAYPKVKTEEDDK